MDYGASPSAKLGYARYACIGHSGRPQDPTQNVRQGGHPSLSRVPYPGYSHRRATWAPIVNNRKLSENSAEIRHRRNLGLTFVWERDPIAAPARSCY